VAELNVIKLKFLFSVKIKHDEVAKQDISLTGLVRLEVAKLVLLEHKVPFFHVV